MKKLLLPLLGVATGSLASLAAVGDTFTTSPYTYEVVGEAVVAVCDVEDTVTDAVIPSTVTNDGITYTVTAIGERAFYWSNVVSATLPSTVTEIGSQGFYNCPLASITFGENLKTVGDYALAYTKLSTVDFPEGVTSIGGSCFFGDTGLTSVTFPSTLRYLGASCFYKAGLTAVELPEGMEILNGKVFLNCSKLAEVKLPSTLTEIGDGAFYGCTSLTSITLPDGMKSLGDEVFYDVPLTEFTLPAALEKIGGSAFTGTQIAAYTVAEGNTAFSVVDDVLYTADKTMLISFPPKCALTELTLPTACLGISSGAFDKTGIQKVTVGNKFRAFDEFAFCQSSLSEINFPESCVFIGKQAFAGTNLTNVTLPARLPQIQEAAFAECEALNTVTLPATLNYIDIRAFYGCTSLTTVNCLGMTPPVLEDWYEAYESPFYNLPSSATCNIPAGSLAAYKGDSRWNSVFANRFVESLPGAVVPESVAPAADSQLESFDGLTLSFAEEVSIVKRNPAVTVQCGPLAAGVPVGSKVSVDDWYMVADSKTALRIFPADYDGYTSPFNMELGIDYYVTIPAGVLKNAAGNLNEELTVHYNGSYVAPKVQFEEFDPADNAEILSIGTISITFTESVSLQSSKLSDIKVVKGELVDGVPTGDEIAVERWWPVSGVTSGTKISIFAGDEYDGYAMNIDLEQGTDYYVVLPKGLFRLSSTYSAVSDEVILHYTRNNAGVELVKNTSADVPAEIYTVDGRRITDMQSGHIYIVRRGDTVTKVLK